jgi:S1-C subfamily serine protease
VLRDDQLDLALLHLDSPPDVSPVELDGGATAEAGESVAVIGYPLGLSAEVSIKPGIVSAFRSGLQRLELSTPVNPGNSGGPVVRMRDGRIVAIVTSKVKESEGMGLAVPLSLAQQFLQNALRVDSN